MSAGNIKNIPHFLTASTPQELMRLCFSNNVKDGTQYNYFSIQKDGSRWIAWYYKNIEIDFKKLKGGN